MRKNPTRNHHGPKGQHHSHNIKCNIWKFHMTSANITNSFIDRNLDTTALTYKTSGIWVYQPIHLFLVGCLNPCLQGTSVRVVLLQPTSGTPPIVNCQKPIGFRNFSVALGNILHSWRRYFPCNMTIDNQQGGDSSCGEHATNYDWMPYPCGASN